MKFTPADRKNLEDIETKIRDARIPPSNGDDEGSFPNDVAKLLLAQEKLNDLVASLLMRHL